MLRELLYFDIEKCASILSQIEGGLPTSHQSSSEVNSDQRNIRTYNLLHLFKGEFGGISQEKSTLIENRILHDYMLIQVEKYLSELKLVTNLNNLIIEGEHSLEEVWEEIPTNAYISAIGLTKFEDYTRLNHIAENFNEIIKFINQCSLSQLETNPEVQALFKKIDEQKKIATQNKNRNASAKELQKITSFEQDINKKIEELGKIKSAPAWLMEGIQQFINVFYSNKIEMRMIIHEEFRDMQLICTLKRNCFIDSDSEIFLSAYGTRPTEKLTVLGIITSKPEQVDNNIFAINEKNGDSSSKQFENGFRNIFIAMEGIEDLIRFSSYPNIRLLPLAIYRNLSPAITKKD